MTGLPLASAAPGASEASTGAGSTGAGEAFGAMARNFCKRVLHVSQPLLPHRHLEHPTLPSARYAFALADNACPLDLELCESDAPGGGELKGGGLALGFALALGAAGLALGGGGALALGFAMAGLALVFFRLLS